MSEAALFGYVRLVDHMQEHPQVGDPLPLS